jgi:hypothetical protein
MKGKKSRRQTAGIRLPFDGRHDCPPPGNARHPFYSRSILGMEACLVWRGLASISRSGLVSSSKSRTEGASMNRGDLFKKQA